MSVPDTILNFPAAHCKQGLPLGPVDPALHVQSVTDVLPGVEFEFGGHVKQLDATAELYMPTEQRVQSSSASWLPDVLTTSELYLPVGQFVQDEVPIFIEILRATQTTQSCPATQCRHVVLSDASSVTIALQQHDRYSI